MELKTKVTFEQHRLIGKALWKHFLRETFLNGAQHGLLLFLMNFVAILGVELIDGESWMIYLFAFISGIFIFSKMSSKSKENNDILQKEIQKIIDQK
jgi:hypothetical protein